MQWPFALLSWPYLRNGVIYFLAIIKFSCLNVNELTKFNSLVTTFLMFFHNLTNSCSDSNLLYHLPLFSVAIDILTGISNGHFFKEFFLHLLLDHVSNDICIHITYYSVHIHPTLFKGILSKILTNAKDLPVMLMNKWNYFES